jgi:hypothetical protein
VTNEAKRNEDMVEPLVRTFSVSFAMTDEMIQDLGLHLKARGVWIETEMDTVQIEDCVCMAVFKAARANSLLDRNDPSNAKVPE